MQGSSAISRRAWGIQEQHFSDWAACIWISAGARIWGTLLSRESNSPCKSHPSSAFLELSLLLVTSFHWPLRALYFLEFFSFFLFPPLSGLWALFFPPISVPLSFNASSCLSPSCFYWHMDLLGWLPRSRFWSPDNTGSAILTGSKRQARGRRMLI